MNKLIITLLAIFLINISSAYAEEVVLMGDFSSGKLNHWGEKEFDGITHYEIVSLDDKLVLKAESHSSASGLFKEQRIDLRKTPYLNWRWRIENRLPVADEKSKSGDDYSARVYVIVRGGWAFWKTKAINYVWARNTENGDVWPNAYAGKSAMMIAIRSSKDKTKTWQHEKRNILEDLKLYFGGNIDYIDAVAIMTDTDNAKGDAIAYYGDIYFSEK